MDLFVFKCRMKINTPAQKEIYIYSSHEREKNCSTFKCVVSLLSSVFFSVVLLCYFATHTMYMFFFFTVVNVLSDWLAYVYCQYSVCIHIQFEKIHSLTLSLFRSQSRLFLCNAVVYLQCSEEKIIQYVLFFLNKAQ